jgi:hypothetical protein
VRHDGGVADEALDAAERLGEREEARGLHERVARSSEPSSTLIMPVKPRICRFASSCCGCDGRPG